MIFLASLSILENPNDIVHVIQKVVVFQKKIIKHNIYIKLNNPSCHHKLEQHPSDPNGTFPTKKYYVLSFLVSYLLTVQYQDIIPTEQVLVPIKIHG